MKKGKEIPKSQLPIDSSEKYLERLTCAALFIFGIYNSILYFGHTAIPISDFASFFETGKSILHLRMPVSFKYAPVVGILQNLLVPIAWGPTPDLTAGWLLNAILHPFTVVLLWLVGKRIIGRSAVWFALIATINPWTIYSLTQPIGESPYLFFILLTVYFIFRRSRWAYLAASITTMVRYEGAALIMAAFVVDIIHRKNRRDIIKAFVYSFIASVPLILWMTMTAINWQSGTTHYFNVLFSKEYAKAFTEPVANRTGLGLHMKLLWHTGFQSLLMPYPGAGQDLTETIFKLGKSACVIGFVLGCLFSIFKRRWEVLVLILFFVPYFIVHAFYPYPLMRFHSTIFWIALLIAWFGLQSVGQLLTKKIPLPRIAASVFEILLAVAAGIWCIKLFSYFPNAASVSPTSASIPYVAMLMADVIAIAGLLTRPHPLPIRIPRQLCVVSVMCLVIASNQFPLAQLLGDGQREIEFKMLGEWFVANAKPGEKLAVYQNDTQLFAGKYAENVTGFPRAENPKELVEKLRQNGITYVVWATREGYGDHTDYRLIGLDKNIAFLDKPRSIGPYEFITQVGTQRGYVNIFRLKNTGDEQLPKE